MTRAVRRVPRSRIARRFPRRAIWITTLLLNALVIAGCGLRRDRVVNVADGGSSISGVVKRSGVAVAGEWVKLYNDATDALVDSALTNSGGAYGLPAAPAGQWMVKVSSAIPGDFGYVRFLFASSGGPVEVPPLDLAAHGFEAISPADSATVPQPNIVAPLHLTWAAYQGTYKWSSAHVTDTLGVRVWISAQGRATSADWNGIGNTDPLYVGRMAPPGRYAWRVKIHLPNGVHAATRQRLITLGGS